MLILGLVELCVQFKSALSQTLNCKNLAFFWDSHNFRIRVCLQQEPPVQ